MADTAFGPQGPNFATVRPPFDPAASGGIDTWFKNCSAAGAKDGTYATADWFNVIIDQLRTLVEQAGIPLDGTNSLMLFQAVAAMASSLTAFDEGNANTIAFVIPTPSTGFVTGLVVDVKKAALGNTGNVAAIVNSRASVPVKWADGTDIGTNQWPASAWARLKYDATNPALPFWALMSFPGPAVFDTGGGGGGGGGTPATPLHRCVTASTSITVPNGYTSMVVELWGGGGGGGASLANGAGATGGGGGAHSMGQYPVIAGQVYAATVGVGGVAIVNANGAPGTATSLGALLSATGGTGGAECGGGNQTVVGNGGIANGGNLANDSGFNGGQSGGVGEMVSGPGGSSPMGGSGGAPSGGLGGAGAIPGGGGSGGSNGSQGAAGAPGRILITFYP